MNWLLLIVAVLISASGAAAAAYVYFQKQIEEIKSQKPKVSEEEMMQIADKKALEKVSKAEKEALQIRQEAEDRIKQLREKLVDQEKLLVEREDSLNKRSRMLDSKTEEAEKELENVKTLQKSIEEDRLKLKDELEKISGLTRDEARDRLMKEIEEDLKNYEAKKIRDAEKRIEAVADEKSKNILIETMQRIVTDYVGETTTSTIKLEDENIKGRVIGKEGRNIRAFEQATGVDVIVDESPTSIGLSSFDPLRREIAKVAMQKLIADGRIHPGAIEEAIKRAKNEIASEIKKNGQVLAEEADWPGIDIGLLKLIGKMKYRTSYGQTLMKHTIEVVRIGAVLAAEVGADADLVKKACLLHDVGKVLTHKVEGPHHHISGQIARKYELPDKLVNAIEAHHLDIEPQSVEAVLVYLADAISGARPGARKDSYEQYIKRVEALEKVAKDLGGNKIDEVFAIHAGRELRVIVKPQNTDDDSMAVLAKDIATEIQKTQQYPGSIQVTVIRESRVVETAI